MPKTHFATDGFYTACGYQIDSIETSLDVLQVSCKSCRRTTIYKKARKEYFEKISRDRHALISFMDIAKKVSDWIKGIFK